MKKSTLTTKKRRPALFLALAALPFLLTGCQSSFSHYDSMTYAETAAAAMPADTAAGGYDGAYFSAEKTADSGYSYSKMENGAEAQWEVSAEEADYEEEYSIDTTDHEISSVTAANSDAPLERKLIRNIDMEVETTDFDQLLSSVKETAAQMEGYVEQSVVSGNSITLYGRPSKRYASLTLRIPAERLDQFVSRVETDSNITYRSENVSDVTLQYSDVKSRLKTLRMEQERLWELMEKADSAESIVILEERLTEVLSEIESCESRLRYLDNSVTYSTVYLNISEVDLESPTQPESAWEQIQRGFSRNLNNLGYSLRSFIISLVSNLPTILFDLLILLLLFFAFRALFRRFKKNRNQNGKKTEKTKKKWPFQKEKMPSDPEKTDSEASANHTDNGQ